MLIIGGKKIFYNTNLYKSLIQIFGINIPLIKLISRHSGIPMHLNFEMFHNLGNIHYKNQLYLFFKIAENHLESILRRQIYLQINSLIELNCYRGLRHKLGFPTRGQRTHTNAKTIKYLKNKKKVSNKYKRK